MPILHGDFVTLRPYRQDDVVHVQRAADDPLVARWMTHRFPAPYTNEDARDWVAHATRPGPVDHFAIEAGGEYAGGIGIIPLEGEHAGTALFGYWLGRSFWSRGVATDAARVMAHHALTDRRFRRLEASVFAPNIGSMRVLEKAGFVREGVLRLAYVERDGNAVDAVMYGRLAASIAEEAGQLQ